MRKILSVILLVSISFLSNTYGQRYKKYHRDAVADLTEGKVEQAREKINEFLTNNPWDKESLYIMAMIYGHENNIDKAMEYVIAALREGLPFERFLAGPRDLLRPIVESEQFRELLDREYAYLIHGPMLSDVNYNSASFWVRTTSETPVQIIVSESEDMEDPVLSEVKNTQSENDYTAVLEVDNLKADHIYYYRVKIGEYTYPSFWSFQTFPREGYPARFSIGFGGGAGFTPKYKYMWNTISSYHFPAFLFLGDNVYIDHPEYPDVQDYVYYRRQSVPEYRFFTARTSIFAIWDDHDFGTNDSWGTAALDSPEWKIKVWQKFKTNWSNPYYGGGKEYPGVWFDFSIGDVDIFMLDGRYYRTGVGAEKPEMLGGAQKEWLFNKLKASNATFKIIASPVPWSYGAKTGQQTTPVGKRPGAADTWEGFQEEREKIFSFIEENKIVGVFLISADRHRSDAWQIIRPEGYDLFEFESSKLTNIHTHPIMSNSIFGYNQRCSFGMLEFDTTKSDPEVIFRIVNIDNRIVNQIMVKRSQLEY